MPRKSRWSVDIPVTSLPSLIFGDSSNRLSSNAAFVDCEKPGELTIGWNDFALWSKRLAVGLQVEGLLDGDRVLLFSGNNVFVPIVFMGVIMAGGTITTANPAFVSRELAYQIKDCSPRFVLIAAAVNETALAAAKIAGFDTSNIFVFDDNTRHSAGTAVGRLRHWSHLLADTLSGREFCWERIDSPLQPKKTAAILYSSGTTGEPKGVELSHYSLVANCVQLDHIWNLDPRNRSGNRLLAFLPMYHGLGLLTYAAIAPYRRSTVYVMKRYSLTATFRNIERFGITELTLVPPILIAMAQNRDARQSRYDLSSIRRVQVGAAPLSREMCELFERRWPTGVVNVKQGWGMTELPTSVLGWDDRDTSTSQAVGEPLPNCEVKLVNEQEIEELRPGVPGELWCKAPQVMKGYWGRPQETRDTVTPDGWLKTGDIAYADNAGRYVIIDRKKELIKVKGNQVAPAELEAVLLEHPEIQDAAVVGIKQDNDEKPRAYVVRRPGRKVSADDILAYMAERTAKVKRLTGGIIFCDTIPKNPSGKILRRLLLHRAEKEMTSQGQVPYLLEGALNPSRL